jgi:hypothetical protein
MAMTTERAISQGLDTLAENIEDKSIRTPTDALLWLKGYFHTELQEAKRQLETGKYSKELQ